MLGQHHKLFEADTMHIIVLKNVLRNVLNYLGIRGSARATLGAKMGATATIGVLRV